MKDCNLFRLCNAKKWPEVREYLSSDAAEEEKRSNIMYRNRCGTCFHRACYHGAPRDIIKAMLDIGGRELIMKIDDDDSTVLNDACIIGASFNLIEILINVGGKDLVMAKDKYGETALYNLCRRIKRHTKAAEKIMLILQVGDANLLLSAKNHHAGETPLEIATGNGAANFIKKLLTVQKMDLDKKVEAPGAEISRLVEQKEKGEKDNKYWKDKAENYMQICSQYKAKLQEMKDKASAPVADIPMIKQEEGEAAHSNELEESNKKIADLVATVEAQRVTIVALSNEKDDIEKECRDEADKLTQMCSQRREELQLLIDFRNAEGTKRKYSVEEHQKEEGSVAVSQSQSQSSKRSRLESMDDTALVASDRKPPKGGRLEMITRQLLNEREQHSKLIQQLLDAWKELEDVKARNVQMEEDAKLD